MIRKISVKIRRRETPFYDKTYLIAKKIHGISMPYSKWFHSLLYLEWAFRRNLWHSFWRVVYYEPMFKSQCIKVGKGFRMEYAGNGCAQIIGNLQLSIGDNVKIFDNTSFFGLKVFDKPELSIGNNTYIGPLVRFMVGKKITIGDHCLITSRMLTDNPGHPVKNILERIRTGGGSPSPDSIKPISIGNFCFIPLDTYVYPGVTIGDGVVARVGTHISQDVPPFCQIAGNPMKIVRKLPIPPEVENVVGTDQYNLYKELQKVT